MAKKDSKKTISKKGNKNVSKEKQKPLTQEDKVLEKTTTTICYNFSESELKDKAQSLGEAVIKLVQIEDELNSIKSDYKKKLTEKQGEINELSNHVTTKYEMRNTPCFLHKNFKMKERQYLDHEGTILKVEPLTSSDYQTAINISEEQEEQEEKE